MALLYMFRVTIPPIIRSTTLIQVPKVLVASSGVQNYSKFHVVAFLVMTSHSFVGATNVSEKHIASIFMCH